jgi:NADP-dependent 3-hydroxy acid dehydrogenase YdfG
MVLVAATLATMSAASAFADELSDSQLRHKIHVIQNRPGPVTNQERNKIQDLRSQIDDNDDNGDDDDGDDDEGDNDDD